MTSFHESHSGQPQILEAYKAAADFEIEKSVGMVEAERQRYRPSAESPVAVALKTTLNEVIDGTITHIVLQKVLQEDGTVIPREIRAVIRKSALNQVGTPPAGITKGETNPSDYALPMFAISKGLKTDPNSVADAAKEIAETTPFFEKVEAKGPYVNVRVADKPLMAGAKAIIQDGESHGRLADNSGKVAVVDYSGPNIAKPFGVNHLRSTVIGEAMARLLDATGYTVVRDNHLGDWGTQFGNLLAAHDTYASEVPFESLGVEDLNELYVRYNKEAAVQKEAGDLTLVEKGRQFFAAMEGGDPDLISKWASAIHKSRSEFEAMYQRLGIKFDTQIGEGYFAESSQWMVEDLAAKVPETVVTDAESGAVVIHGSNDNHVMLRTEAGYCVYAARDLATLQFRVETYNPDLVLYVVGQEQDSPFKGVFEVAEQAGLDKRTDGRQTELEHIKFGMLLGQDGKKLSTRRGTSGKLDDVLGQLDERATEEVKNRNPDLDETQAAAIAKKLSVAALIWNDLRTERKSSVHFDIDRMLELSNSGVTGVLYSYARSASILDKVAEQQSADVAEPELPEQYSTETEHHLAVRLNEFGEVIRKAANERAPHLVVGYLQELAHIHSVFYEESRVQGIDDPSVARMRVQLHKAYTTVVGNGLGLLNIPLTERL